MKNVCKGSLAGCHYMCLNMYANIDNLEKSVPISEAISSAGIIRKDVVTCHYVCYYYLHPVRSVIKRLTRIGISVLPTAVKRRRSVTI